ncbi:MAG: transposase, partial [Microcystaceae cyanobacterium]
LRAKASQFGQVTAGSIPNIVRCYKAAVTKKINQICQQKGTSLIWQRNYYEQVIRDEKALTNIRQYIRNNPLNWHDDPEYSASKEILLDLPF